MTWTPERNKAQGLLIADLYGQANDVACGRNAIMAGGLRGADKASARMRHRGRCTRRAGRGHARPR